MPLVHDPSPELDAATRRGPRAPGFLIRVWGILFAPRTEWVLISKEMSSALRLCGAYVIPLAALAALALLLRLSIAEGAPRASALTAAALTFGFEVLGFYLVAVIISLMAPSFAGTCTPRQALKIAAYSLTPLWVASVLASWSSLSLPVLCLAGAYHAYLLYLGLSVITRTPRDRAFGYAMTVVLCAVLLGLVFTELSASLAESEHLEKFRTFATAPAQRAGSALIASQQVRNTDCALSRERTHSARRNIEITDTSA